MGINEQEALARQLFSILWEAMGDAKDYQWESISDKQREAWIQVAQYVIKRMDALVDVSLDLGRLIGVPDHK